MGQPQVSAQALINEASRHKTWESLEAQLMNLIVSGQVLEYQHMGDKISVTLDGTTRPVFLPVNPNAPKPVPAVVFEPDPEPKGGGVAVATKPKAKNTTIPAPTASVVPRTAPKAAPVGVVALVGLKAETYESHVRRLVQFVLENHMGGSGKLKATIEAEVQDWFKSLK